MKTAALAGPIAGLCTVILSIATPSSHAEEEVVATLGGTRVTAKVDLASSSVRDAKIERQDGSVDSWEEADSETDVLNGSMENEPITLPASFVDCNENGLDDFVEIADGAQDFNFNLVPDECEYGYGDLNLDGEVDGGDMFVVLGWFAAPFPIFGDLNEDGIVDAGDMGILLARWGRSPF